VIDSPAVGLLDGKVADDSVNPDQIH